MGELWFPYGSTEISVRIPEENLLGTIEPKVLPSVPDVRGEIARALENPINSKRLIEMVKPDDRVVIVIDDHTRPVIGTVMLPPLLDELSQAGIKDGNITILIATGTHRAVKSEEAQRLVGEDASKRFNVVCHDCRAPDLVEVGTTSQGVRVKLNRAFSDASFRILTGDINLHYYAGYGGGRKSILGIAGLETIQGNHAMLLKPRAQSGVIEGNPIDKDLNEMAEMAKVNFILNVVMNKDNGVVKAFAGDLRQAFLEGIKIVDEMCKVEVERAADILVVSAGGSPYDIDLYQSYKAIHDSLEIVKDKGVIVLIAECPEGYGNQVFYDWMTRYKKVEEMETEIKRRFVLGGHKAYYLSKALEKVRIILVSIMPDFYATGIFKLRTAKTANEALHNAFGLAGKSSKIWALPKGSITLPVLKKA
jgi:nickel-dependent lactate racemase